MIEGYLTALERQGKTDTKGAAQAFAAYGLWTRGTLELAVSDLGARLAEDRREAAELLRQYQDVRESLRLYRQKYIDSFGGGEAELQQREARGAKLETLAIDEARLLEPLHTAYPQAVEVLFPKPDSLDALRARLRPGEGVMVLATGEHRLFVWLISSEHTSWHGIDVSRADLNARVDTIRLSVDLTQPPPDLVAPDCRVEGPDNYPGGRPFDACMSRELHSILFENVDLTGIDHLMIVPDGPLERIPFSLLVTGFKPGGNPRWLIETLTLSALPTASAVRSLQGESEQIKESGQSPFLGIAPGEFSGHLTGSPLIDIPRALPATVPAVLVLGGALGADRTDIVTGARESESFVKNTDLTDYAILNFATHGLIARETIEATAGLLREPSLILSGPGPGEDGLLTASEVALLRLDAEWVLLSACNTSSGASSDAEDLTGLARAFLIAGARSLVVSHWSVEDQSALILMRNMIETYAAHPTISKAGALRQAMLSVMNTPSRTHPFFWAPFELVGEGLGSAQ